MDGHRRNHVYMLVFFSLYLKLSKQQEFIDQYFLEHGHFHCPDDPYVSGSYVGGSVMCALMCLIHAQCNFYHFEKNDGCWLRLASCQPRHSTSTALLYERRSDVALPAFNSISSEFSFIKYPAQDCHGGDSGGVMSHMGEADCVLICLLDDDCTAVAFIDWGNNVPMCHKKIECGQIQPLTGIVVNTYVKPWRVVCVPGFSCYAVYHHNDGVGRAEALAICGEVGGHLLSVPEGAERTALEPHWDRLVFGERPVWVGLEKTDAAQWTWTAEGQAATDNVDYASGSGDVAAMSRSPRWTFYGVDPQSMATPVCELPGVVFWRRAGVLGGPLHRLSDGDLDTCMNAFGGERVNSLAVKRLHFTGAAPLNYLKVHGKNLVCSDDVYNTNIYVMDDVTGAGAGFNTFRRCNVTTQYVWRGGQLCLFACVCQANVDPCGQIVITVTPKETMEICEITMV